MVAQYSSFGHTVVLYAFSLSCLGRGGKSWELGNLVPRKKIGFENFAEKKLREEKKERKLFCKEKKRKKGDKRNFFFHL